MPTKTDSKDAIAAAAAKKAAAAQKKTAAADKKAAAAQKKADKLAAAKTKKEAAKAAAKEKKDAAKAAAKEKAAAAKAAAKEKADNAKPKAGPPFKFALSGQCENPIVKTLNTNGVCIRLMTAEARATWYWGHQVILPANGKSAARTLGSEGVDASETAIGYSIKDGALYEAAKDALATVLKAGKAVPKGVSEDLEGAIERLKPAAIKQAEKANALVEYNPDNATGYLAAFNKFGTAHHSGVILADGMDLDSVKSVFGALEFIEKQTKWMRADCYIYLMKHFPKAVEGMFNEAAAQTLQNEATVARAFPHDERREGLTFSHHAEVANVKSKAERKKWLDKAEDEGLTVAKLRKEIADAKAAVLALNAPATTGEESGAGGKDGGAGTPVDPNLAGGTPAGDGAPAGTTAAPAGAAASGGTPDGQGGQTPADDYSAEATPEQTPAEKAEADLDAAVEKLDAVETLIRGGLLSNVLSKASRVKEVRQMIAKLYELANAK